jgi:hypothetical protein
MNGVSFDRMRLISHLAINHVRQMMEGDPSGLRATGTIDQIDVSTVRLSLNLMSDEMVAREVGAAIYRALARGARS